MAYIKELLVTAEANEAKTIYDMHKASCKCAVPTDCACEDEWDTLTLLNGGSARASVLGETITLTYTNGVVSTYTGTGEVVINPNAEGPLLDSVIPVGTI